MYNRRTKAYLGYRRIERRRTALLELNGRDLEARVGIPVSGEETTTTQPNTEPNYKPESRYQV